MMLLLSVANWDTSVQVIIIEKISGLNAVLASTPTIRHSTCSSGFRSGGVLAYNGTPLSG